MSITTEIIDETKLIIKHISKSYARNIDYISYLKNVMTDTLNSEILPFHKLSCRICHPLVPASCVF